MLTDSLGVPSWLPSPGTLFTNVDNRCVRWYVGAPRADGYLSRMIAEDVPAGVPVQVACTLPIASTHEHYIHVILPSGRLGHRVWSVSTTRLIKVLA